MSKESRRAARAARESRRLGAAGAVRPAADGAATSDGVAGDAPPTGASPAAASPAGIRRPDGTTARAGRRDRVRRYHEPTFLERRRNLLIGIAAAAVLAVVGGVVFLSATQPVYACTNIFDPSPTPPVAPGSSARIGFVEPEMGRQHVVSRPQRYLYCPPASGNHINQTGQGPLTPRVYGPQDNLGPPNWVHNLEHGALVVLYRNDSPGATAAGQQAFREFHETFPESPICKIRPGLVGPVIARFDSMAHPYAVLVWGRVLYLDTWDPALALRFFNEEAERVDADGALVAPIENVTGCVPPSASPGPTSSVAPSAAPSAVPSASAQPSPAPS